jgi:hypothetical protein
MKKLIEDLERISTNNSSIAENQHRVFEVGVSYVKNVVLPIDVDDSKWSEIAVVDIPKDVEICGDEQVNDEEIQ